VNLSEVAGILWGRLIRTLRTKRRPRMTTETAIRAVFDKAQAAFVACWQVLANIRATDPVTSLGQGILEFQPTLAKALYALDQAYRELDQGRGDLVKRKASLSPETFLLDIRRLGRYQEAIYDAIRLGKTLGDAFAWFFYDNDRNQLYAHLKHEPITEAPTGTGFRGEFTFIDNVKVVDGHLVLYHGITTILRHGDVSLIDLNTFRVTALGELKTRAVGADELQIMVHFVSPKDRLLPATFRSAPTTTKPPDALPPDLAQRLQRQLKGMGESFEPLAFRGRLEVAQESYYPSLMRIGEALEGSLSAFEICGDGLLLAAFRTDKATSLFDKLLNYTGDTKTKFQGIESQVHRLIDPRQGDTVDNANRLDMVIFGKRTLPGAIPLCWCPVDPVLIKKLLFQDVTVVSLYNPAHLARKLREKGFTVTPLPKGEFDVRKVVGGAEMSLRGFDFFRRLVQEHLIAEEVVVDTMSHINEVVASGKVGLKAQIPLFVSQEFRR
jgi:hypothetical protein